MKTDLLYALCVNRFVFKIAAVLALSTALVYSGVAWAVANCSTDRSHSSHVIADHHDNAHPAHHRDHSSDPVGLFIHCASPLHEPRQAVIVTSTTRIRATKAVPIHKSLLPCAIAHVFRRDSLQPVIKQVSPDAFLLNFSRRLFLSILQI